MRVLIWLQRDLRIHDHEAFIKAEKEGHEIICLFVLDEEELQDFPEGFPRWSDRKRCFLSDCLRDLHYSLQFYNVPLLFREGDTVEVMEELASELAIDEVWFTDTAGTEEEKRQSRVQKKFKTQVFQGQSLLHSEDIPFEIEFVPGVFTEFRKRVEKFSGFRSPMPKPSALKGIATDLETGIPVPAQLPVDPRSAFPFRGGEEEGLKRLKNWMWGNDRLKIYKETRNQLLGTEYSSKLSPWLAWGCISPRFIVQEIARYEKERVANRSTYWLTFELLWRDFFIFLGRQNE